MIVDPNCKNKLLSLLFHIDQKPKQKMEKIIFVILVSWISVGISLPTIEEKPSEASLKLAREIVSYYKSQNKQFFPYYPIGQNPQR